MQNLKKQILDLKWLLERSSDLIQKNKLDQFQTTLQKASSSDDEAYRKQLEQMADNILDSGGLSGGEETHTPVQSTAPSSQELHRMHHDDKFRQEIQDYAKQHLNNTYAKNIRDAEASNNPGYAATGHAYHTANPQHSNKFAKEFEDQHNKWKQDEEFQKLSPREQYQKMAEFQKQHWEDNPDHVDEFVSSGKERNAYANATKLLREGKIKGEEEDIAQGGAGVSSDMTGHAAQQHIGTSSGDEDAGGPNIQQNPTAKISGGNPTAARIFAQEQEQKKQSIKDMIGHNATNDPNNPIHTERLDRLKGMQPDIKAAQDIVGSVADKHKDIREQDIQQKLKEHQARGFVDTKSPKEQLSAEYLPKMNTMAEKLINSTGTKGKIEPIDLIQAGQQGLWEAARDFNPKVHNFKGLAARRIKARMRDVLKAQIGVSKPTQERIKMLEEAKRNMQSKLRPQEGDE